MKHAQKFVLGIDEAGRGPLAGPVAVGVVKVPADFDWDLLPGVGDSKQVSEANREKVFVAARKLKASGQLDYAVAMVSAQVIDRIGIVGAIKMALSRGLKRVDAFSTVNCTKVNLDGGLKAPSAFVHQETIIKGDSKEPVIGLASIMAKVTRDRYMRRIAKQSAYKPYQFDVHKGYGTKQHQAAIEEYSLCDQHRRTFCSRFTERS